MKKNIENNKSRIIFLKRLLISFLCIFLIFLIYFFVNYGYCYLFDKEERGHLASIFFNLNKFEIDISEDNKNNCEIFWNRKVIYQNGAFLSKNINSERYVYGDNYFKVSINNVTKYYYLFKPNNWEFHNFKFSVSNDEIIFWIDGIIINDEKNIENNKYITEYYERY
jgi:hypothetical protein